MSRYPLLAILLVLLVAGLSCSGGGSPVNNEMKSGTGQDNGLGREVWGAFDLQFQPVDGTAKIVWQREAQAHFSVKKFITPPNCYDCIQVTGSDYQPENKRWYIELAFRNPTNFTGRDVRAVISDLGGGKQLINPDGVTEVWGSPMVFRAINVDAERTFGPQEVHGRVFDFYFPDGDNWGSVSYLVDASVPGYVEEPLIENANSPVLPNNGFATVTLTAKVWDHQGDLLPNTVSVDLSSLGGSPMTAMYDDGTHGDGPAGNGVFGTAPFSTSVQPGYYMANIFAMDAASHLGWGQGMIPVQGGTTPGNDDPIIDSVGTDRTTARGPSEKVKITVNAHDPDDDPMGYDYEATSGSFSGQSGNTVNWTPTSSNCGSQTITVSVLDDKGGTASQEITLWSTNLQIVAGNTGGMMPSATLSSFLPSKSLDLPEDFENMVVYMNFWGTWCGPCVVEMPELQAMHNKYKSNDDWVRLQIGVSDSQGAEESFISSNGYSATYWCLSNSYFSTIQPFVGYSNGVPTHMLFDRDGYCRWAAVGSMSSTSQLEGYIEQLL